MGRDNKNEVKTRVPAYVMISTVAKERLSEHTVKNYLFRIFEKLGVSNRVELLSLTLQPSAGNPTDRKENSVMRGVAVAILTEHREQQLHIQNRVEATGVARIVFSHLAFPHSATDAIIRQMRDQRTEVVVVDLHPESLQRALNAIALIQNTTSDIAIFAMGEISNPTNIVAAMRAGAREYVDRQAGNEYWLDAFARFAAARTKKRSRWYRRDWGISATRRVRAASRPCPFTAQRWSTHSPP
jgi:DNA-binding NarL/FixJ family response regulator